MLVGSAVWKMLGSGLSTKLVPPTGGAVRTTAVTCERRRASALVRITRLGARMTLTSARTSWPTRRLVALVKLRPAGRTNEWLSTEKVVGEPIETVSTRPTGISVGETAGEAWRTNIWKLCGGEFVSSE